MGVFVDKETDGKVFRTHSHTKQAQNTPYNGDYMGAIN